MRDAIIIDGSRSSIPLSRALATALRESVKVADADIHYSTYSPTTASYSPTVIGSAEDRSKRKKKRSAQKKARRLNRK
jgi:hypothetical protein